MDRGKVVEQGTHAELLENGGAVYQELWNKSSQDVGAGEEAYEGRTRRQGRRKGRFSFI